MSLAGAGQRRYLAGVERRQLDMLGPVSFLSFTIQLYIFTIYFFYTLKTILHNNRCSEPIVFDIETFLFIRFLTQL